MRTVIFILVVLSSTSLSAQNYWTLQECFNYAMDHNISIRQISLSKDFAENTVKQSKMQLYLPNASASINETFSFGSYIDYVEEEVISKNTNSTNFGINASYGLFEGLTKINTLKANEKKLLATEYEIEEAKNTVKIFITNLYMQIVIANDVLKIAKEKQALTRNQYRNTQYLVHAGIQASGALLDLDAQIANDELNVLSSENNLERSLNKLKLLLQLDPYSNFGVEEIVLADEVVPLNVMPENTAASALKNMPEIRAAKLRIEAAKYELKIAKGRLLPSLILSGNINTRFYSDARHPTGEAEDTIPGLMFINNAFTPVSHIQPAITTSRTPYMKQLKDNLNESISIGLNIPILGAWHTRTAIANAKVNILKIELDLESKKNKINEDVFIAYTDLQLAQKRYNASLKSTRASNEAYNYANEKFKAGIVNSFEFETAKNRKINAQSTYIQAKYELFFKKIILDFYETGRIRL